MKQQSFKKHTTIKVGKFVDLDLLIAIRRGQRPLMTVSNKDPTVQKDNVQRKLSGYVNGD